MKKPEVNSTEAIAFELRIQNSGSKSIALGTPLAFGHTLFLRLKKDGSDVSCSGSLFSSVPGEPKIILPSKSVSVARDLRKLENTTCGPLSPGRYSLSVCYIYPGSYGEKPERNQRLRASWRSAVWVRNVVAGPVEFEIRE